MRAKEMWASPQDCVRRLCYTCPVMNIVNETIAYALDHLDELARGDD